MNSARTSNGESVRKRLSLGIVLLLLLDVGPAAALVVDPFFAGHSTVTAANAVDLYAPVDTYVDFGGYIPDVWINQSGYITEYGANSDAPGSWTRFDANTWAPFWNDADLTQGGQITYGNPFPGVFAVSWVGVPDAVLTTLTNTFQVVLIGTAGFATDKGEAISPGSVVFAYGSPGNANGTINLPSSGLAAIGVWDGDSTLLTLNSLGIGSSDGFVVLQASIDKLRASDPFLFDAGDPQNPIAFNHLTTVPEPDTDAVLLVGLGVIGLAARRRGKS